MKAPIYVSSQEELDAAPGGVPLVAGNGTWMKRECPLYSALVPVSPRFSAEAKVVPKPASTLPAWLVSDCVSLFSKVHKALKTECVVLLRMNDFGEWFFLLPYQKVSAASVSYDSSKGGLFCSRTHSVKITQASGLPKSSFMAGSFHSHSSMPAFHSGTDLDDEIKFDGVHAVAGSFGVAGGPSFSKELASGSVRTRVDDPPEFLPGAYDVSKGRHLSWREFLSGPDKKSSGAGRRDLRCADCEGRHVLNCVSEDGIPILLCASCAEGRGLAWCDDIETYAPETLNRKALGRLLRSGISTI